MFLQAHTGHRHDYVARGKKRRVTATLVGLVCAPEAMCIQYVDQAIEHRNMADEKVERARNTPHSTKELSMKRLVFPILVAALSICHSASAQNGNRIYMT